jgi:hypothetical protein
MQQRNKEVFEEFTLFCILFKIFDKLNPNTLYENWWKTQPIHQGKAFAPVQIEAEFLSISGAVLSLCPHFVAWIADPKAHVSFERYHESRVVNQGNIAYPHSQILKALNSIPHDKRHEYVRDDMPQFWQKFDASQAEPAPLPQATAAMVSFDAAPVEPATAVSTRTSFHV